MTYDLIVIGGGVVGCATARAAAQAGQRVALLEQFVIGHRRGSSHGNSRIIRYSYEQTHYVHLMRAAYAAWAALEAETGEELLVRTGGLDFGRATTPDFLACQASMRADGIAFELLDGDEVRRRFPQFTPEADVLALYQADAGLLRADEAVAALAASAHQHGATIHEGAAVTEVAPDGEGVRVAVGGEIMHAERAVIAAGPWAKDLLAPLGLNLPLRVTREQVAFFVPQNPALFAPAHCPVFVDYAPPQRFGTVPYYGLPIDGIAGFKIARHGAGPTIEPTGRQALPLPQETALLARYLRAMLPGAAGWNVRSETCRYTKTPDTDFIIDRHPAYQQIVIGSPCSGHGFKFGALNGQLLADLAFGRANRHDLTPFRLARFWHEAAT